MEQHRSGRRGDAPRCARLCPKPWENTRLLAILRTQIDLRQALRQASRLEAENRILRANRARHFWRIPAMAPVLSDWTNRTFGRKRFDHGRAWHRQGSCCANPSCVIGTGDEANGDRECGRAIRRYFRSELFGHVKGAFTDARADRVGRFELADGSTLFLDEIANVPLNLQAKLLRVLETGDLERVGSSTTRRVNVRCSRLPTPT